MLSNGKTFVVINQDDKCHISSPATTLSIALSKSINSILVFRSLAAIKAASLHTLAISAPTRHQMDIKKGALWVTIIQWRPK